MGDFSEDSNYLGTATMATPATARKGTGANANWDEDQLRGQINDVYQQELGRDADDQGMSGFLDQAMRGANVDQSIRSQIRGSDEYKNKGKTQAAPSGTAQSVSDTRPMTPPQQTSTNYNPGAAAANNRATMNNSGQGAANNAVGYASNPNLDALIQQMIASDKANQARSDSSAAQRDAFNQKVRSSIMDQYDKANQPIDPNDPTLSHMKQVHDATSQRALNQGREAMAARGSQEGTTTGANDAYLQSSYENLGKDNAAYGSNLDYNELNNRRSMIQNLLSQGEGVLSGDESRMLSDKLGTMDASMKDLGLKSGAYLSGQGLDDSMILGTNAQNNQNNQFYDNMSNNDSMQAMMMNEMIMRELAGG